MLTKQKIVPVFNTDAENGCAQGAVDFLIRFFCMPKLCRSQGHGEMQIIQEIKVVEKP